MANHSIDHQPSQPGPDHGCLAGRDPRPQRFLSDDSPAASGCGYHAPAVRGCGTTEPASRSGCRANSTKLNIGWFLRCVTWRGQRRVLLRRGFLSGSLPLRLRAKGTQELPRNAESQWPRRFAFVAFFPGFARSRLHPRHSLVRARVFGVRVQPPGLRSAPETLPPKLSGSRVTIPRKVTITLTLAGTNNRPPRPFSS